jgi:hypothetical protein
MKVGLIQTRGLGDIVIAAPIAQHFLAAGAEVIWPVDARFHASVQSAFPDIRFLPVDHRKTGDRTVEYFYHRPMELLTAAGCDAIHCLYAHLSELDVANPKLARSLKFDEYKYAICRVPFSLKWRLRIVRNPVREGALLEQIAPREPLALVHDEGSTFRASITLPEHIRNTHHVVRVTGLTDNPFDWLGAIERAAMIVFVDSVFANLAEQLDLCPRKYLVLRSEVHDTPVFKNNWRFG